MLSLRVARPEDPLVRDPVSVCLRLWLRLESGGGPLIPALRMAFNDAQKPRRAPSAMRSRNFAATLASSPRLDHARPVTRSRLAILVDKMASPSLSACSTVVMEYPTCARTSPATVSSTELSIAIIGSIFARWQKSSAIARNAKPWTKVTNGNSLRSSDETG